MSAVRFETLGFAYRPGRWVLRGCSGGIGAGRVLAILGPNGRGKSTLLKLLLGALAPIEGRVAIDGAIAFVPQLFDVAFGYRVLDMVLMGRARQLRLFAQPTARDRAAALAALDRLGIAGLASRSFHDLSGGQRQLVNLARALVSQAQVLLLDEPTSALDLRNQALVLDRLDRLARDDGLTIVLTTHHPQHALAIADEVVLMLATDRFLHGTAAAVLTEPNLTDLYGVAIRRVPFRHGGRDRVGLMPILDAPPTASAPAPEVCGGSPT